jgi:hypothetical protein
LWTRWALLTGHPRRTLGDVVAEHMESPGTKAYTQRELRGLFSGFRAVSFRRYVTPYDRRVAGPIANLTGPRFGWFVGIVAKP